MPKYAQIDPEPDQRRVFSLDSCAHSEIGPVRKNNQDSAYVSSTMIVVADGMGGAAAGDVASTVAIQELRRADGHYEGEHMLEAMAGAVTRANDRIADLITYDHSLDGMGTTVSGAMFSGSQLGLVHIGDSRGYLLRDGSLTRLTHDHSWVQSLVDAGKITEAEAAVHPHRSLLLKVLNGQPTHEPDYSVVDLAEGDRLLFCSDGLCGLVDDRQIRRLLRGANAESAMRGLVDAAYAAGGYDNITLVISDVVAHSERLDARPPLTIGAASTVEVPRVPDMPGAPEPDAPTTVVAAVSDRPSRGSAEPDQRTELPAGLIDPDARENVRYTPTMARPRRRWPIIVSVLAVLMLLAAGLLGAWRYTMGQYYIAPTGDRIGIWQGLPDQVAGRTLGKLVERRDTKIADLPLYYAQQVRSAQITAGSLSQAQSQADYLDRLAKACVQTRTERLAPAGTASSQDATASPTGLPAASSASVTATAAPSSIPISGSVNPQDCS